MCISLVIDTSAILSLQNAQNVGADDATVLSLESLDGLPISEYSITGPSISLSLPQDEYRAVFSGVLTTTSCTVNGLQYTPCLESAFVGFSAVQWEQDSVVYRGPAKNTISFNVFYAITPMLANHQMWKYKYRSGYSSNWLLPSFDASSWPSTSSLPSSGSEYLFLRTSFTLQDSQSKEAIELQFRVATPFALSLNGILLFSNIRQSWHDSPNDWSTSTLPASFLREGENTIIVCISPSLFRSMSFDLTARVLPATPFQSYATTFSTDDSFSTLFDGDLSTQWEDDVSTLRTVILYLQFPVRSQPMVNDLCLMADSASLLPPEMEVAVMTGTQTQGRATLRPNTVTRTEPTAVASVSAFCWRIQLARYSTAVRVTMRGRGHIRLRDATFATRNYRWETEAFAYPLENNAVVRPYEATCFEPSRGADEVSVWSAFTRDYHTLPASSGVTVDSQSGELCLDNVDPTLSGFVVSGFESDGYKDMEITILQPPLDCVDAAGQTYHHGEEKREGDCLPGYSGYTYRVCFNGTFGEIQYDHCSLLPPSDLHYEVADSYYVNEMISLSPTVSSEVSSFTANPSLPEGLTLNSDNGVISGSVTTNMTISTTITATNPSGSTSVGLSLVFKYHGCEPTADGYEGVESGEISKKMNSCLPGYSGYTYRVCFNGTFGEIQYDHCSLLPPSDLHYEVADSYYVNEMISLSPTVSSEVNSFSADPSLPDGLSLNSDNGVISGSVATNMTITTTITATNPSGSVATNITLVFKYHGCEPTADGYEGVESGEISKKMNSCLAGYSGYTYRLCFDGTFGEIQYDHCSLLPPSDLRYEVADSYFVNEMISLSPTVSSEVSSFSADPSLPEGLSLNSDNGVISGSVTTNMTIVTTITATNPSGSITATITLVFKYHGCEPTADGYEGVESGEISKKMNSCLAGYSGYTYRVCFNGTFGEIQYDHCSLLPPSDLHYEVADSYFVNEMISLSPTVSSEVSSFTADPSLPEGLSLNSDNGVISGSVATNMTITTTITATNPSGSVATNITLVFKYHGCESTSDGYEGVESGEISKKMNSCLAGYSGYTYRVCFDGTFGEIQYDHCSLLPPSDLRYEVADSYFVNEMISLSPTVSSEVSSFTADPSLPEGLSLNSDNGVISGSVTTNMTITTTITATNPSGSVATNITLVFKYHGCESTSDGYEGVESGEISKKMNSCLAGYSGYTYRVCFNGTFGEIQYDHCSLLPPSDLHYEVADSYFVNEMISLSPTVSSEVSSFTADPSLPEGLSLNSDNGVISGSVTTNMTIVTTITATNPSGSTSVGLSLVFKYHGCESTSDGYEGVESGEISKKMNSCLAGYSGYTYRVCFDGTFGEIQYDHCSLLPPSDLRYEVADSYFVNEMISLSPTVSSEVSSFTANPLLPEGLSLDERSGVISGSVPKPSEASYTITATNTAGSTTTVIRLLIVFQDCEASEFYPGASVGTSMEVDCANWGLSGRRVVVCEVNENGVGWRVVSDKCYNLVVIIAVIVVAVVVIVGALLITLFSMKKKWSRGSVKVTDVYV